MKLLVLVQAVLLVVIAIGFGFHYGNTAFRIELLTTNLASAHADTEEANASAADAVRKANAAVGQAEHTHSGLVALQAKHKITEQALSRAQESLQAAFAEVSRLETELRIAQQSLHSESPQSEQLASTFFTIPVAGKRVAFVIDISGSMRGERLTALKRQMWDTTNSLPNDSEFLLVAFHSDVVTLSDQATWLASSKQNKAQASVWINALESSGGTQPWAAFEIVYSMTPLPDAIYFLTDGAFDTVVADQIFASHKRRLGCPVHCITLIDKSAEDIMKQIAQDTGGHYVHIPTVR